LIAVSDNTAATAVFLPFTSGLHHCLLQADALPSRNCFNHDSGSNDCHSSAGRWSSPCFAFVYAGNV